MPIIKAAKIALRQSRTHQKRNLKTKLDYKTAIREVMDAVKAGKADVAVKSLSKAQKLIDMAAKKHLMHKNTASRKKVFLARTIAAKPVKKAAK